ncbi:ErfK/YbiS/YcfS/YnhG family protein [Nostoc linckia z18]|jgi:lipoprotein-anchoring transpeptidase ErfK/SrfK|uniref:ErfK/YbiS/YcfS/YnhG family protein n=2 Tax=Nostoc linckia TaxID=92942 RepID=A0A9Q5ZB71_NOSLI|nr:MULTISPECIES: L,D-transpeptidase [Nostoc]PHK39574.1 ErfK/YbiS/YcfS/YnhG family protein [Nostoc linckia z15]PHK44951.1 ErfK/YbiS/YcfS/YnhG family protein [Nostoc linckia z16]MBC1235860.1 L,D-transpeptidase [Nostoc sp. 2RC]PHJ66140.1 ErfK/YbiS/YcfS/YnhG family protein [Nostoc linckia z3]PHJ68734.1 ErfK/YbiS/YcfS/YnhG family protein [Nostoc linckia z1]
MKRQIYPNWVRNFKILLAGTALSLSVFTTTETSEVWANSQNPSFTQTMQKLQKSDKRWIQINLTKQRLIAWEGDRVVYGSAISSGKKSTPTLVGTFNIQSKFKTTRMRGTGYDVPNVPYAMFYQGNYGIHGAYWHKRFGTPVSHGCVNLAPKHAKWLFGWASVGTPIVIHK